MLKSIEDLVLGDVIHWGDHHSDTIVPPPQSYNGFTMAEVREYWNDDFTDKDGVSNDDINMVTRPSMEVVYSEHPDEVDR